MKYHCIMSVWGREYTDFFLDAAIANQLQPGNLPALARQAEVVYYVHTTSADAAYIRAHPAFGRLSAAVTVRLEEDDGISFDNRYQALTAYHAKAVATGQEAGAALVFLAPDLFFPDGTFARVHALRRQGKRLVMVAGPRGLKEALADRFLAAGEALSRGETRVFSARELVGMLMAHPHHLFRHLQYDSPAFHPWPSHVYWQAGDEGYILRAFHLHPIMVDVGKKPAGLTQTVDGEFIESLGLADEQVYVVPDSDELFALDLTRDQDHDASEPNRLNPESLADWARQFATPRHQQFFRQRIALRVKDPGPAWNKAQDRADALLEAFDAAIART